MAWGSKNRYFLTAFVPRWAIGSRQHRDLVEGTFCLFVFFFSPGGDGWWWSLSVMVSRLLVCCLLIFRASSDLFQMVLGTSADELCFKPSTAVATLWHRPWFLPVFRSGKLPWRLRSTQLVYFDRSSQPSRAVPSWRCNDNSWVFDALRCMKMNWSIQNHLNTWQISIKDPKMNQDESRWTKMNQDEIIKMRMKTALTFWQGLGPAVHIVPPRPGMSWPPFVPSPTWAVALPRKRLGRGWGKLNGHHGLIGKDTMDNWWHLMTPGLDTWMMWKVDESWWKLMKVDDGQTARKLSQWWRRALCSLSISLVAQQEVPSPPETRNGTVTFGGHEHMGASGVALVWMNQAVQSSHQVTKSWKYPNDVEWRGNVPETTADVFHRAQTRWKRSALAPHRHQDNWQVSDELLNFDWRKELLCQENPLLSNLGGSHQVHPCERLKAFMSHTHMHTLHTVFMPEIWGSHGKYRHLSISTWTDLLQVASWELRGCRLEDSKITTWNCYPRLVLLGNACQSVFMFLKRV